MQTTSSAQSIKIHRYSESSHRWKVGKKDFPTNRWERQIAWIGINKKRIHSNSCMALRARMQPAPQSKQSSQASPWSTHRKSMAENRATESCEVMSFIWLHWASMERRGCCCWGWEKRGGGNGKQASWSGSKTNASRCFEAPCMSEARFPSVTVDNLLVKLASGAVSSSHLYILDVCIFILPYINRLSHSNSLTLAFLYKLSGGASERAKHVYVPKRQ